MSNSTQSLYEQDFHAWLSQAALDLHHHNDAALDWDNLAEEIDGMVKSQKRAIASNTKIVILTFAQVEISAS